MPADRSPNPSPTPSRPAPRRWAWWKRVLAVLGVLLLLLAIFHRPIIFGVARYAIHTLGAKQGLDVDLKLGGTIFTSLRVEDLHATPTRPGPIRKANVGRLEVSYSLPTLIRGGLNAPFLGDVVLHDADVVYDSSQSPPEPPKKKEAFKLPPLPLPDSLSIHNVNFQMLPAPEPVAKAKGAQAAASSAVPAPVAPVVAGTTQAAVSQGLLIKGLDLELDPQRTGAIKIAEARIPGGPDLKDVAGTTSYHARNLQISDLVLAPDVTLRNLGLDASKLATQEKVAVTLDAALLGGTASANILLQGTKAPPKATVRVDIGNLSFAKVRDFLKLGLPLDGTLSSAAIRFEGNTDQPNTWVGYAETKLDKPAFGKTALDAVNFKLNLHGSNADLEHLEIVAGENRVSLGGKAELPAKMADLVRANARGFIKITVPDLGKLPVEVSTPLAGSFDAGGDLILSGGTFKVSGLKGHAGSVAAPAQRAKVSALDLALDAAYALPAEATAPPSNPNAPPPPVKPFWQGLTTRLAVTSEGIVFGDYKLDAIKSTVSSREDDTRLETLEVIRADNNLTVSGTYRLPADFARWQKNPLAVQLDLNAPDVSQFSTDLAAAPLQGSASAKGNVTLQNGAYAGGFDLQAKNLRAKGAKVETADIQIGIVNSQANVRSGHIVFDDKNHIDITGQAALQAPYPFDAGLDINLSDLSRFEPVLRANNVEGKIGGSLQIVGKTSGHAATSPDANDQSIGGSLTVTARALEGKGAKIDSVDTQVVVENNTAVIKTGEIRLNSKSTLTFGGQADVGAPHVFKGNVKLDLPDLSSFQSILAANKIDEKISGSLAFDAQASGHLATATDANDQVIDGSIDLAGKDIRAHGAKLESIDGHIVATNEQAIIKTFVIRYDAKNIIDLAGQVGTRAPFAYQGKLNVNLQDLKSFEPILRASQEKTTAQIKKGAKPGSADADGLIVGPAPQVLVDEEAARQGRAKAALEPASNRAAALSSPKVSNPPARADAARATFVKNSKAAAASAAADSTASAAPPTKLAGALQLQWDGQGNFAKDDPRYAGNVKTAIRAVEFNALGPVQGDIAGSYAQQDIDFPTIVVSSNGLEFRSTFKLAAGLARLDNLSLKQGSLVLLAGYAQVPVDLQRVSAYGGPIPDVDKIDINVASKALSLQTLFASIDKTKPAPVQGTVELGINAHGSLSKIVALVKVQARGLNSPDYKTIRPADLDINLALRDNKLDLDTSLRQPQLNTLTIKGNLPVDLNAIAATKELDPALPVNLTVSLPRSDLSFLSGISQGVRFVQGTLGADVRVAGTVGKPTFAGSVELDVPAARAANITVPSIRDFHARLAFTREQLRFERFDGEIGGGKFGLSGQVNFVKLTEPVLALAATAKDVLAVRDDNVTVRVNADVKVSGPVAAASVTGYVGLTKSRYLKDIDIVPLNLPGKPAPTPPAMAQSEPSIGITSAPLKDWKFNIDVRTDDPFFVRGNLANGQASVDLHLRGTGAKPLLDGNVNINNLTTSLPFSRLEINNGNILFTPDQPLNPTLNLTGTSEIRSYLVTLLITGRAKDPKITFTSEPPLPQEQIVSLLATGATTDELAGNATGLAGKATLLVLEDLYRRTFKKKNTSANATPRSTLTDRLTFDVGSTDPTTGKQELTTRYKITDQVQFYGDFGIQGDLRGRIKYLIRFR